MAKRIDKVAKAAHIKRNTEGTSNEISFSVLDAAKNSLDGEGGSSAFGTISLFTLPGKKKHISTPSKDEGLALAQREASRSAARAQVDPSADNVVSSRKSEWGSSWVAQRA
mgnify:CR=1 FL=1